MIPLAHLYSEIFSVLGVWGESSVGKLVNCLPFEHKDLNSIPRTHTKKPGMELLYSQPQGGRDRGKTGASWAASSEVVLPPPSPPPHPVPPPAVRLSPLCTPSGMLYYLAVRESLPAVSHPQH